MVQDQNAAPQQNNNQDQNKGADVNASDSNNDFDNISPLDEDLYQSFSDDLDPLSPQEPQPKTNAKPSADQIRIAALEDELSRTKDHMMRSLAEAENGRKRAMREREDASKFAVSRFSKDLVNVADNLRRAIEAVSEDMLGSHPQVKTLIDGIEATERELLRSFEKNGITKLEPMDQPFDPNFHEVMFEASIPGKIGGTIIQVLEPGYLLNGRILRPARVGVAKSNGSESTAPPLGPGHSIDTKA